MHKDLVDVWQLQKWFLDWGNSMNNNVEAWKDKAGLENSEKLGVTGV